MPHYMVFLAGLADAGKALGHVLHAVVDVLLDIGQRSNGLLEGSLDLVQRLHHVLLDLFGCSAGVLLQLTQHLADLLCVDGQLIRADEHERHDDDHDEFPKTNFHNDPIPFLCRCGCAALLGAKMCRSLFARCLFCPDLRGFGAVCAFAATLIPKFGGLNMNLF